MTKASDIEQGSWHVELNKLKTRVEVLQKNNRYIYIYDNQVSVCSYFAVSSTIDNYHMPIYFRKLSNFGYRNPQKLLVLYYFECTEKRKISITKQILLCLLKCGESGY